MVTIWLVVAACAGAQAGDIATITQHETIWNEAHLRGDVTALRQIFAEDLVVIVPGMRPLSKADSLAVLSSGRMTFQRYASSEVAVRIYADIAVITGRLQRTRVMVDGTTADDDWRFTKVVIRRADQWQVVSFHASNASQ
jgi:ketosteroid isomerase-like protein